MGVEINAVYEGNLRCTVVHEPSGTTITTDAPADNGGKAETFSPTDLAVTSLGTCIITIMGLIAEKLNVDIKGTKVHMTKEMAAKPSRKIGSVKIIITMPKGIKLTDKEKRMLENAADACPVKHSLHHDVNIETKFVY
ncbi:MAG: OsmC family protein [Alphaproteobacteria bacterium]|nr:OsmC family protein [Alphaproteobacteria bacterium]